ncbi:MAG: hypothetical protein WB973_22890, partial [Thermoanaerobaculia bacterium]
MSTMAEVAPVERRGWFAPLARQAGFDPQRIKLSYWTAKVILAVLLPLIVAEFIDAGWLSLLLV